MSNVQPTQLRLELPNRVGVKYREEFPTGRDYLDQATTLLQSWRRTSPTGGMWEAADIQWWWRRDQHSDPRAQIFLTANGSPRAAFIIMNWGDRWQADFIFADPEHSEELTVLWPKALAAMTELATFPVEMEVNIEEQSLIELALGAGFVARDELAWSCWMDATDRPGVPQLRDGFSLESRADSCTAPHPFVGRSGQHVEARLLECSLYRPDLDLAVINADGKVAGYSLFWADPVTGVGLVEPMRTEDELQGLGIARYMLASGLERLTSLGCTRLKVSSDKQLYLSAGFERTTQDVHLSRSTAFG